MEEWIHALLYDLRSALIDEFDAIRNEKVMDIWDLEEEWFEVAEEEDEEIEE